jgi:hypothetical protein
LIALLLAAVLAQVAVAPPTAPPDVPPLRDLATPDRILARYAEALAAQAAPSVVSFEYALEQTGARDLLQTHRVFRSGTDQRDEILSVDGRTLDPPAIRITHGRRDRYAVAALAPKADAYVFRFVGPVRNGHHNDFVFETVARAPTAFRVTDVRIDGITYLPTSISFETDAHAGTGTITFARIDKYWMVTAAIAHATYAKLAARERITFSTYTFPPSLPPSTFSHPHPMATDKPAE